MKVGVHSSTTVSWLVHATLVILLASTLGISASAALAYQSVSAAVRLGANSETGVASILAQAIPEAAISMDGAEPRLIEPHVRAVIRQMAIPSPRRVRVWSSDARLIADSSGMLASQEPPAIGVRWLYQIMDDWLDRAMLRMPQSTEDGIEAALGGASTSGVRRNEQDGLVAFSFAPLRSAGSPVGAVEVSSPIPNDIRGYYPYLAAAFAMWLVGLLWLLMSSPASLFSRRKGGG